MFVYVVFYIHTDMPEYSEVLKVCRSKEDAIHFLIKSANYQNMNGSLCQYMEYTDDYESYENLYNKVEKDMELKDTDIYKIEKMNFN